MDYGQEIFQELLGESPPFFIWDVAELGECELFFRDFEKKQITFKHPIYIGVPINLKKGFQFIQQLPCFIGKDFLDKNFLSIIKSRDGNSYLQEID